MPHNHITPPPSTSVSDTDAYIVAQLDGLVRLFYNAHPEIVVQIPTAERSATIGPWVVMCERAAEALFKEWRDTYAVTYES